MEVKKLAAYAAWNCFALCERNTAIITSKLALMHFENCKQCKPKQ